ncbi:sugar ABC transporter ATP-binding protein [Oceanobacillus alkalisoli]|uniref:sugar ABC transporter ATP-binding protein n=1 Tax=Oceanobacillus alkalisoli TaxID=2925113 RepID=UPI001EEF8B81|nr:sugar ABC transporter ATP-binding protein [Oceanobacillus alkalisoli]MCF3944159.1 sugar ABC transporter ATP-binding protein [Oceanobacillus alkalisoli]MCG5102548.1 sugar ABC transporter ATP-binding protein [Oceanobacillus alkalisoli]
MSQIALQMKGINKAFSGVKVLKKVNFEVGKGETHALMGGNGAGKSTLMKILTGVYTLDSGEIIIDGKSVEINNPNDSNQAGVAMIFQEFSLIPKLTVAQNIYLNREPRTNLGFIDDSKMNAETQRLLDELDLHIKATDLVEDISVGYWQMTEIVKAISNNAKIVIMDEPTSTLSLKETEKLFDMIDNLRKKGITIIYISHRMDEIFKVCDRITILRDGENVITERLSELTMDDVVQHIIGGKLKRTFVWEPREVDYTKPPLLEVRNLQSGDKVKNVSFDLYRGEILGFAGLMGSGRSETVRALFGIDKIRQGTVCIDGKEIVVNNPMDAMKLGLALVPEDRREQGLILEHSVKENMILPILKKVSNKFFVQERKVSEVVKDYIQRLNIKTDNEDKIISLLSGGNQQKVVLSKWLANSPDILILDEPTSGVDIGAKSEILKVIRELADQGKSVIVISSEITELLAVSDRLIIYHQGTIANSIPRENLKAEEDVEIAIQNV